MPLSSSAGSRGRCFAATLWHDTNNPQICQLPVQLRPDASSSHRLHPDRVRPSHGFVLGVGCGKRGCWKTTADTGKAQACDLLPPILHT
ncbi:hypothetical protein VTK26DRAFT_1253 [Humicola hyalothermophila]